MRILAERVARRAKSELKIKFGIGALCENVNHAGHERQCLMRYITSPFEDGNYSHMHQNRWQAAEIARLIGECGYNVDVINYDVEKLKSRKHYDAVFDIHPQEGVEPIYSKNIDGSTKRIVYLTGSDPCFARNAELKRVEECRQRRRWDEEGRKGIAPRRIVRPISHDIEKFDAAIMIGNQFNLSTFREYHLPQTYLVPNTAYRYGRELKLGERSPRNFVYFGSEGCIHKGLDLLLEVFAEKDFPCELYVCGGYEGERDFCEEYKKELYEMPNIHPVGFISQESKEYEEIVNKCTFTLLPSCSEGMAGSITTMMEVGIIPICSRECGYEDDEVIMLETCSLEEIKKVVLEASRMNKGWIDEKRAAVKSLMRTKYSDQMFSELMEGALRSVLE